MLLLHILLFASIAIELISLVVLLSLSRMMIGLVERLEPPLLPRKEAHRPESGLTDV
jgi:hypothetical protein